MIFLHFSPFHEVLRSFQEKNIFQVGCVIFFCGDYFAPFAKVGTQSVLVLTPQCNLLRLSALIFQLPDSYTWSIVTQCRQGKAPDLSFGT